MVPFLWLEGKIGAKARQRIRARDVLAFCFARKPGAIPCCRLESWEAAGARCFLLRPAGKEGIPLQGSDADSSAAQPKPNPAEQLSIGHG